MIIQSLLSQPLLPPSLVQGRSMDSLMMLEIRRADGGVLTTIGSAANGSLSAQETTSAAAGSVVTRVVLRPQAASVLLIGGVPASGLNTLLMLLLGSIVLAGVALLQIRRGRELSRLRTRFVANVSHELRTPLAQISMFSETLLLERERSPDEGREFLTIIFREARRLSHLVESVLSFSRSEVGARDFRPVRRDVAREVGDAVLAFSPLAGAAGVELRIQHDGDCIANVEPDSIRQVMLNLLDNAVKFGPKGQVVSVSVVHAGAELLIRVSDQGPGIPVSERSNVFEPFAQVSTRLSRTTTGAGIGLAVVADVVAAHAGRVWIEDGPGNRGTCITIALPAVARPQESAHEAHVRVLPDESARAEEALTAP